MRIPSLLRLSLALLTLSLLSCFSRTASAYPWMIRRGYGGCVQCHADPSGGGLLTEYGRSAGDTLLRTHYGPHSPDDPPEKSAGFLWGLLETPDWLLLGGGVRAALIGQKAGSTPLTTSLLLMQADLRAGIRAGGVRASATIGVITTDKSLASVTGPLVSREHWVGYAFDDKDALLLRAGRMNLPFGVRSIEHTLWVRDQSRTDLNDGQEHGVSFAYTGERLRGEIMAIAGNYQISPDRFRERGYSGYLELALGATSAAGVSSLVTHASEDVRLHDADTRQVHGLFARVSPFLPLVLLAEGDLVIHGLRNGPNSVGFASMLQADVEPLQGLHLIATGETWTPGGVETKSNFGAWASVGWFFLPHVDLRLDYLWRSMAFGPMVIDAQAFLVQLHAYL